MNSKNRNQREPSNEDYRNGKKGNFIPQPRNPKTTTNSKTPEKSTKFATRAKQFNKKTRQIKHKNPPSAAN